MVAPRQSYGATATEYALVAAGSAFAAVWAVIPPDIPDTRPLETMALLLAWSVAVSWMKDT